MIKKTQKGVILSVLIAIFVMLFVGLFILYCKNKKNEFCDAT